MPETKRKQIINIESLKNVNNALEHLQEKKRTEYSLRESIIFLADRLKAAMSKGYSYQDLTELLAEQKILISVPMLRRYLKEAEQKSKSTTKKSKQNKKVSNCSDNKSASINKDYSANSLTQASVLDKESDSNKTNKNKKADPTKTSPVQNNQGASSASKQRKMTVLSGATDDLSSDFNNY